jgi:predicted PurR-regulated permease PerM
MIKLQWTNGYLLGLVLATVLLFWFASKLGIVLFLAVTVALLLKPLKKTLEKKFSQGIASLLAIVFFLSIAAVFINWIARTILPGLAQFAQNIPQIINTNLINDFIGALNLSPELTGYMNSLLDSATSFVVSAVTSSLAPMIYALSGIVELVSVPFLVFYFLNDSEKLRNMTISFVPAKERAPILNFYENVAIVLSGYIKGQLTVCMFSGIAVFGFFVIMGVPYAPVFAAITAVGETIPVVGPLIACSLAIVFAGSISLSAALKMTVFYFVLFTINHNMVYPYLVGKAISLHPAVIMIALLLFGHLFGPLGMMLAVPVMGVLRVVVISVIPEYKKNDDQHLFDNRTLR